MNFNTTQFVSARITEFLIQPKIKNKIKLLWAHSLGLETAFDGGNRGFDTNYLKKETKRK